MSSHLIKKAILSEKSYAQMDHGVYTFLVDKTAKKNQIKKAVENQFSVNVERVNVLNKSAKTKRIARTRKTTTVGAGKKAVVYLKKGQSIGLLVAKAEKPKSKKQEIKKEIKVETKGVKKGILARLTKSKEEKKEA